MSVNHLSVDFNQAVEQPGMEFRSVVKMEEMGVGATSIWIVCKAVGLDKNLTRMSLFGKDDQGGHTNITVKSETKWFKKKKKRYFSCVCGFVS